MSKIYLSNTYQAFPRPLTPAEQVLVDAYAPRMLWFGEARDAVVLPRRPSPAYVAYYRELTGHEPPEMIIPGGLHPGKIIEAALAQSAYDVAGMTMVPYAFGEGVMALAAHWQTPIIAPRDFGILPQLSNKVSFADHVLPACGLTGHTGTSHHTRASVLAAAVETYRATGSVFLRIADSDGGAGNIFIRDIDPRADVTATVDQIMRDNGFTKAACTAGVRVEQFHDKISSPAILVYIEGGKVWLLQVHDQVIEDHNHCAGVMSVPDPATHFGRAVYERLCQGALQLGQYLSDQGYQGYASFDAMVLRDGTVIWSECNPRMTSAMVGRKVAERIRVGSDRYVVNSDRVPVSARDIDAVQAALVEAGLAYRHDTRRGVVVTIEPDEGHMGVVYVGKSRQDLHAQQAFVRHV